LQINWQISKLKKAGPVIMTGPDYSP